MAGQGGWRDQLSRRNMGLEFKEFRRLPPAARLDLVRERGWCRLCLSRCDLEGMHMHKRCRLKSWIWNELCQEQHKCRQTHHRLLHVDAEGERSPQIARPAKPAEPPDRLRRTGVQPGKGKPRHACGEEEGAHDIRDVGRRVRGGSDAEEEPEAWLWCRGCQASRNTSGGMCQSAGDACNIRDPRDCTAS